MLFGAFHDTAPAFEGLYLGKHYYTQSKGLKRPGLWIVSTLQANRRLSSTVSLYSAQEVVSTHGKEKLFSQAAQRQAIVTCLYDTQLALATY